MKKKTRDNLKRSFAVIFTFLLIYFVGLILKPFFELWFDPSFVDFIFSFVNTVVPTVIAFFFGKELYENITTMHLVIGSVFLLIVILLILDYRAEKEQDIQPKLEFL